MKLKTIVIRKLLVGISLIGLTLLSLIISANYFSPNADSIQPATNQTISPLVCLPLEQHLRDQWEADLRTITLNQGFPIPRTDINSAFDAAVAAARTKSNPRDAINAAFSKLTPIEQKIKKGDEQAIKDLASQAVIASLAYKIPTSLPTKFGEADTTEPKPAETVFDDRKTLSLRDGLGYQFRLTVTKRSSKLDVNGRVSCSPQGEVRANINARYRVNGQLFLNGALKASTSKDFTSYFLATKQF